MEDLTGREFGSYRVVAAIRQGGMAAVYKAYQPAVDRHVALKILSRQFTADPQFLKRFRHEAKIVAQFQHPHIMPVFDFGESDGHAFLAMPFVNGGTLGDLLKKEPLSVSAIVRIVGQICEALDYAHQKGVVHRDVKPSNILMLDRQNCLVADFGLARISAEATQLTLTGAVMGTPAYMSPEQASGLTAETTSDVYSLGVVLYELLTGRVPFVADTPVAVMMRHLTATIPPPRHLKPELSPALEAVVLKALARQPGDRFASAMELHASLLSAADGQETNQDVSDASDTSTKSAGIRKSSASGRVASRQLAAVDAPAAARSRRKIPLAATAGGFLLALSLLSIWLWRVEHRATRTPPGPAASPLLRAGDNDLSARTADGVSRAPEAEKAQSEQVAAPQTSSLSRTSDKGAGETKAVVPPTQDKASTKSRGVIEAPSAPEVPVGRTSQDTNGEAVRVLAAEASVRVNADPNSLVVTKVPAGTVLEVQGREGAWYSVWLPGTQGLRRLGYVAANEVENLGSKPAPAPEIAEAAPPAPSLPTAKRPTIDAEGHTVRAGLDEVRLYVAQMPSAQRVVIALFSATDSDIKEDERRDATKTMQADGPRMLADRLVAKLKDLGGFNDVFLSADGAAIAADTLVVNGRFVELDPGSRSKRYLLGKSAVTVEGTVKAFDGAVLARFRQRRTSVTGIGGDPLSKLSGDTRSIGEDIAKFISEWAKGKLD